MGAGVGGQITPPAQTRSAASDAFSLVENVFLSDYRALTGDEQQIAINAILEFKF